MFNWVLLPSGHETQPGELSGIWSCFLIAYLERKDIHQLGWQLFSGENSTADFETMFLVLSNIYKW